MLLCFLALSYAGPADLEGRWNLEWTRGPATTRGTLDLRVLDEDLSAEMRWGYGPVQSATKLQHDGRSLALVVGSGEEHLQLDLRFRGDRLQGTVRYRDETTPVKGMRWGRPDTVRGPAWVPIDGLPAEEPSELELSAPVASGVFLTPDGRMVRTTPVDGRWQVDLGPDFDTLGTLSFGEGFRPLGEGRFLVQERDTGAIRWFGDDDPIAVVRGRRQWTEVQGQRLVLALATSTGGLRVVAVSLDDGTMVEHASHASADDVVLDGDLQPRVWIERTRQRSGRGVSRDELVAWGPEGQTWAVMHRPEWVVHTQVVPRIGDGPVQLIAGDDLTSLGTLDAEGFHPSASAGAWADATHLLVRDGVVDAVGWSAERLHWDARTEAGKALADVQERLQGDVVVTSRSEDDQRWTLHEEGGGVWPRAWLFDRSTGELAEVPQWDDSGASLRPVEPHVLVARDGRKLAAYVTTPDPEHFGDGPWPTVLGIHGGPWSGRHGHRNTDTPQRWARRGYATVQVDFRGTRGFGWASMHSIEARFGGQMMDDLHDGIAWAIELGVADPDRIAAVGWSYGGYASLRLVTAEAPVVRCAVAAAVRGNLLVPGGGLNQRSVGSRRWRKEHSPDEHTDRISGPVLVENGSLDGADADIIQRFVERGTNNGAQVTWLRFPWEGHGLSKPSNFHAYRVVEDRFLSACLGGPALPFDAMFGAAEVEVRGSLDTVPGLRDVVRPLEQ